MRSWCPGMACAGGGDDGREWGGWLASISPLLASPQALAGGLISGDSSAGETMRAAAPPARALCQLQPCARCDEAAGNGSGPSAASRHVGVWRGLGQGGLQTGGLQNPPGWRGACGAGMRGTHVLGLGKSLVPASWTGSCPLSGGSGRQGLSGGCLGQGLQPGPCGLQSNCLVPR